MKRNDLQRPEPRNSGKAEHRQLGAHVSAIIDCLTQSQKEEIAAKRNAQSKGHLTTQRNIVNADLLSSAEIQTYQQAVVNQLLSHSEHKERIQYILNSHLINRPGPIDLLSERILDSASENNPVINGRYQQQCAAAAAASKKFKKFTFHNVDPTAQQKTTTTTNEGNKLMDFRFRQFRNNYRKIVEQQKIYLNYMVARKNAKGQIIQKEQQIQGHHHQQQQGPPPPPPPPHEEQSLTNNAPTTASLEQPYQDWMRDGNNNNNRTGSPPSYTSFDQLRSHSRTLLDDMNYFSSECPYTAAAAAAAAATVTATDYSSVGEMGGARRKFSQYDSGANPPEELGLCSHSNQVSRDNSYNDMTSFSEGFLTPDHVDLYLRSFDISVPPHDVNCPRQCDTGESEDELQGYCLGRAGCGGSQSVDEFMHGDIKNVVAFYEFLTELSRCSFDKF